jgi:hypothetical protein
MIRLLDLAASHAWRRKVLSLVAVMIPAIMAAGIVAIVGDSAGRSQRLLETLRDPVSRSITLTATKDVPIPAPISRELASMPGVEQAAALPPVVSVTATALFDPNVSVGYGELTVLSGLSPLHLTSGRQPQSGEAVASSNAIELLRMTQPLAASVDVNGDQVPIVGTFTADAAGAVADLARRSIIASARPNTDFRIVAIVAREPADVTIIVAAANLLLPDHTKFALNYEPRAANLQKSIAQSGANNLISLTRLIVLIGASVQLASSMLNAILQRRENARRRALGFTRSEIVAITAIEAAVLTLIGATLGATAGVAWLHAQRNPTNFAQAAATVGLLALVGLAAAGPGGATAAFQDPARILRVP